MKRIILSLLILSVAVLFTGELKAQQDPYTTHYAFNRMLYNPAVAGSLKRFCVTALSHYQYLGYEDRTLEFWPKDPNNPNSGPGSATKSVGPKTQMFSFSAPVTKYGGLGIGFIKDKLGYETSTHLKIDAAGIYPMANDAFLSVGLEVNFLQKGLDGAMLKPLAPFDPSIPSSNVTATNPIFGAGAYYINPLANNMGIRNFWVGLSAMNLNKPTYSFGTPARVYHTPETHYYLMGGVDKLDFLGNSNLIFHPSVMIKYNAVPQLDMTALVEYQQKLWGGVAYRTTADAFSILLGYSGFKGQLQGLRVGYSYDLTLTKILTVSSGTHELQLNYCFTFEIPVKQPVILVTPPFMHRDSD